MRKYQIRWPVVAIVALAVAILFIWESRNLKIETDILESMPQSDAVLSDARIVIKHLPIQDRVFVDIGSRSADRDSLVKAASFVAGKLKGSGLFTKVGISEDARYFPELLVHITENMPLLFDADGLEKEIKPLLDTNRIKEAFIQNRQSLEQLEGIGRSAMLAKDPLGFSGIIMRQLSAQLPVGKAQFYEGQLISEDGRHALIIAKIGGSGTDTATGAKIAALIDNVEKELQAHPSFKNENYEIDSAGAYRAALDNETFARHDMRKAVVLTVLGIALLLLFTFPRPVLGLLALLPSAVGAIAALFVCSLFFKSMSILAVGFGGAIMAFTVDLGIAYLLFLDQPRETDGRQTAKEVWTAELLAVLTTVGAFLLLLISDFSILAEVGVFSALGVTFAMLFVHFIFPKIFPVMPPAVRIREPLLFNAVKMIAAPAKWKMASAIACGALLLFFAWPVFNVDISSMNSVSPETLAAESNIRKTWGDLSGKCYVLLEAPTLAQLQRKNDRLRELLQNDVREGRLSSAFLPSSLFPSPPQVGKNLEAWGDFWDKERLAKLSRDMQEAAEETGFAFDAFGPFWETIGNKKLPAKEIPEKYFDFFGITKGATGYAQLSLLTTGKNYDAEDFFSRIVQRGGAKIFDAGLFNRKLGDFLKNIFLEMALISSAGIVVVVFLYFLDWLLSIAVLTPIAFALVSTLGTLKLIGHPLDIPSIMLWVVIMGMGIDYSIYYVCFYQRYRDENHPAMNTAKMAIFIAAFTTLIGFGVLAFARHSLLHSIGVTSLIGIGYSVLGAYFILPVFLKKIYAPFRFPAGPLNAGSKEHLRRAVLRYRRLPAYPRLFARFKMMIDPMFQELAEYVQNPRSIIDIGCGYGVPAVWLLELYPEAKVYGLEPDKERVRIASYVIGDRGAVEEGRAPDLPHQADEADTVLMLDMLHLISDEELQLVLRRIFRKLPAGGRLLIRATVPARKKMPWRRRIESFRLRITHTPERFRSEKEITAFMASVGFTVAVYAAAAAAVEEKWFVGKKDEDFKPLPDEARN